MATLVATPGAANANSYETLAEAQAYFDTRTTMLGWDNADDQSVLLMMATRALDMMFVPHRRLVRYNGVAYYITTPQWTGTPATATQALAWPRIGMKDRLGRDILSTVIPQELKDALSEFAGQLGLGDRTLDSDVAVQGIKAVRAGSVSVNFKDDVQAQVIPDAVWNLMPDSWFTDELIELALGAMIELL